MTAIMVNCRFPQKMTMYRVLSGWICLNCVVFLTEFDLFYAIITNFSVVS
jgi:hypothetical protein